MKTLSIIATTTVSGVALAAAIVSPALAWHPQGTIIKQVQNVTAGTTISDANTAATAVAAKPGDTLKYTITISNPADAAANGDNDLASVVMKDSLPTGVELISTPSLRDINENIGTILPGKSVTKTYTVKVTATKDTVIENQACFTGNSIVNDAPKAGCDTANIKVTVPPVTPPVTPPATITPPTPSTPTPIAAPTALPATGPANIIVMVAGAAVIGYALNVLRLKRAYSSLS